MMKGIWFDDIHSYDDLNLVLSKPVIPPAVIKTNFVDNPGGDGSIDLTEALGEVKFKDRECTFTFTVFPQDDFEEKKKEVSNLLNGRKCKIRLDKDSNYYWMGRCSVNDYASDRNLHKIVVGATVQPYKYKLDKTRNVVYFCGKNLIDLTKYSSNDADFIRIENETIYIKYSYYNGLMLQFKSIPVDPNNTYTFSYKVVGGDRVVIAFYDENGNNISETASTTGNYLAAYNGRYAMVGNGLTIKMSKDVASIQIGLCAMNNVAENAYNEYSNIQLEVSQTVTAYEPYTVVDSHDIILTNSRKTVCPTIVCTDTVQIIVGGAIYSLSEGTHKVLNFQLFEGETPVSLVGAGAISFSYQEGDL